MKATTNGHYFYTKPHSASIDIETSEYKLKKNSYNNFLSNFNKINLASCSKELKRNYYHKLQSIRKIYEKLLDASKVREEYMQLQKDSLISLAKGLRQNISTDVADIYGKIIGIERLADYYGDLKEFETKRKKEYSNWVQTITKCMQRVDNT